MDEANIRKYAQLMRELDLTGLEITEGDKMVRLERNGSVLASATNAPPSPSAPAAGGPEAEGEPITSPMVGVFYVAPAEDAPPFVKVGDRVRRGDVLCIIEAMKLMNEITAERDGVITAVCAKNGQTVEYGTELFRINGAI